jgi:putative endonuclease
VGSPDQCYVYILRCADGTCYVGVTTDVVARTESHNAGRGPRFTARQRPVTFVYSEPQPNMETARRHEVQIKHWSRAKKEAIIAGELRVLKRLAKRCPPRSWSTRNYAAGQTTAEMHAVLSPSEKKSLRTRTGRPLAG